MSGSTAFSAPRCYVDVYPYEGGTFTISGDTIGFRSISVSKTIRNGGDGSFELNLAPGGPYGVNSRPTWGDVFTPMTLVVIGMQRGGRRQITMIGLVVSTTETMRRDVGQAPQRTVLVRGQDFTRMFSTFCYYDLTYLIGVGIGAQGQLGLPSTVSQALQGTPDQVGKTWFSQVMAGKSGILADTSFAYRGSRPTFDQLMSTRFDPYPAPIDIPTMASFIGDEGSWLAKFLTFFPWPWYEFFIQTAPQNYYPTASAATTPITMEGFTPASPTLVARVNPLPFLNIAGSTPVASGNTASPTFSVDQTLWNQLPVYTMDDNRGVFGLDLGYGEEEVKNYYVFAPTYLGAQFGQSNGSINPFQLLFSSWVDLASVHRYGFRPSNYEVRWMADPSGSYAQGLASQGKGLPDYQQLVALLSLRPPAMFEPTPNMLRGQIEFELRPDILPGNVFQFAPYRDRVPWTFYCDTVSHSMVFGGKCSTVLGLSRGLPSAVYADNTFMTQLLTGNVVRKDGNLTFITPVSETTLLGLGPGLQPINSSTLQQILSGAAPLFTSPRN